MTESEGVIQYRLDYRPGKLPTETDLTSLFRWFRRCRGLQLIGQDPQHYGGIAYGNLSLRSGRGFVISGTQTGAKPALGPQDLAWVEDFDAARNWLQATGPARPSSEAMTHGQIYRVAPAVAAVIHVHSAVIWRHAGQLGLAVTAPAAGYGTPQMAAEVERLVCSMPQQHAAVFSMGGHADGVVAYAEDMDRAGDLLLELLIRAQQIENV